MLTSSRPASLPPPCPLARCVASRCPKTPLLSFPSNPFFSSSISLRLSLYLPPMPGLAKLSVGARCGGEIATRMCTHTNTRANHMVLMQARLQGLRYLWLHAHTEWWSSASALLRSASLGCPTKAKLSLSRLLRPGCLSDTRTHTHTHTHTHLHTQWQSNDRAAVNRFTGPQQLICSLTNCTEHQQRDSRGPGQPRPTTSYAYQIHSEQMPEQWLDW